MRRKKRRRDAERKARSERRMRRAQRASSEKSRWKKALQFCLNPHLLLCVGIAWFLTNGWCYLFIALGSALHISWMFVVGSSWAFVLWMPVSPEKIVTLLIAIFLLRVLFPRDEKTLRVLREEQDALRRKLHALKARNRKKRRAKRLERALALRRAEKRSGAK